MRETIFSEQARQDIKSIWRYIADDNFDQADKVRDKIQIDIQMLSEHPGMGHHRDDLPNPNHRVWLVYSYLIIYRYNHHELQVLRVIHGARDIGSILK